MAYLVLNPKELTNNIEQIRKHNGPVVFSEVTNRKVTDNFINNEKCYFIDPQHGYVGEGKHVKEFGCFSAILYTFIHLNKIEKFLHYPDLNGKEPLYVLEKPDMDSVGALVLVNWCQNLDNIEWNKAETRIQEIHEVDCWVQPTEWNPDHVQSYEVKWTNVLGAAMSDWKVPIETRVSLMEDFLLNGNLPDQYKESITQEWKLLEESIVETISDITVVTTAARGVSGVIYKQAPYGIGFCENFMNKGKKFTVMEFTANKYLDLAAFFAHMNANFPEESGTWGGNVKAGVGGSPIPCSLSKEEVAKELSKFIL